MDLWEVLWDQKKDLEGPCVNVTAWKNAVYRPHSRIVKGVWRIRAFMMNSYFEWIEIVFR